MEAHAPNPQPNAPSERRAQPSPNRRAMAAILTGDPEELETGNGFDDLTPTEDLVSVIVPSYAHEEFVEEALRSITRQTYRKVEVILIDDHSPDRTYERALTVLREAALPYCALRRAHAGMDTNINVGVLLAHGGWIAILASDDVFPQNSLEVLFTATQRDRADIAAGPVDEITADGKLKGSRTPVVARYSRLFGEALRKALLEEHGSMLVQGMLISRRVFAQVGLFDGKTLASDFDFLIRMASHGVKFAFASSVTALHREPRERPPRKYLARVLWSHRTVARRHANSLSEYRHAVCRFYCEVGFTSFHFGYIGSCINYMIRAFSIAPITASRIVVRRVSGRLRRRKT